MITDAYLDPLAATLDDRLESWRQARMPQEQKLLECYQDVMRIPRDDDTKGTGAAKAKKAKSLFIGSTRNKVRSARAKIKDTLFGAGKFPFDTTPSNEELAPYADTLETILTRQLEDMDFKRILGAGVDTLCTYGTGMLFGPFVRTEMLTETRVDEQAGYRRLVEDQHPYDCPYFEAAPILDCYPDPDAADIQDGTGVFWVTMMNPYTVSSWRQDKRYKNIDAALTALETMRNSEGSDLAKQMRGNIEAWFKDGRIKVARYFGRVPASALSGAQPEPGAYQDEVEALVVMAGGVVVRVEQSPYKQRPALRAVYEDVAHEFWGVGIAENNAPHQKTVNAAFRLYMEGKGMALLGTKSVDRSKFLTSEDFKKYPGKVYNFIPGLTPDERKTAIIEHNEPDVTDGWERVIELSERFSDDDTSITKYTQGNDSRSLNSTATGVSMIMNAASLPLKEVLQNIDVMWIEPAIDTLIQWNLEFLEPETVARLHGEDVAQRWAEIKDFGKTSFMDWRATGASTFVAKEVLMQKLQGFLALATGNPVTAQMVDVRELLEQVWDAGEIGKESPVLSDEDLQKKQQPQANPLEQLKLLADILPDDSPLLIVLLGQALEGMGLKNPATDAAMQAMMSRQGLDMEAIETRIDSMKADILATLAQAVPGLAMPDYEAMAVQLDQTAEQDAEEWQMTPPPQDAPPQELAADQGGFLTPEAPQQ